MRWRSPEDSPAPKRRQSTPRDVADLDACRTWRALVPSPWCNVLMEPMTEQVSPRSKGPADSSVGDAVSGSAQYAVDQHNLAGPDGNVVEATVDSVLLAVRDELERGASAHPSEAGPPPSPEG